jgi:hypothetical protein
VSANADAEMDADCPEPGLSATFQFDSELDAPSRGGFLAWLDGFRGHYATLLAAASRAEILAAVASELAVAAGGSVKASIEVSTAGENDGETALGLACALAELPVVVQEVSGSSLALSQSLEAGSQIIGVVQ